MTSGRDRRGTPEPVVDVGYIELSDPAPTLASIGEAPEVAPAAPREALTATTVTALEVSVERGPRRILDRVSLQAAPGEVVAVTGPSGSGKTTLLALLGGLQQPSSGSVDVSPASARQGLVLQSYGLVSLLTAAENVEIALQNGALGRLARPVVRGRAAAALGAVGLGEVADHLVEELSGGQQQRVAVARALVGEPSVVFADEVSAELDHESKERVLGLLFDLAAAGGTVVLATHDPEIAARCTGEVRLLDGRAV